MASDTVNLRGDDVCGDFDDDVRTECVGACTVTFPAGMDGAYEVYMDGPLGHICSPSC